MTVYEITIEIDSTSRPDRLQDFAERMVTDWFGSTAEVTNLLELDDEYEPDARCCHCQATDDHNEGVAQAAGAIAYTRTDGHTITFASHRPDIEED